VAVCIAVLGLAIYANSIAGPFVFDDLASIPDNPSIRSLWPLAQPLSPPNRGEAVSGRPLVNLSFAVNYALGGVEVRGYHLANIAVHVGCALLIFGIVRLTLDDTGVAAASAVIWMVHPLESEAVDYISARTESLMALCYLGTVYASVRSLRSPRAGRWIALAVASCAAGMACKESMVTAPLIVAAYDRTFAFRSWKEALRRRWLLYGGLAATWIVLAGLIMSGPRAHSAGFVTASEVGLQTETGVWPYLLNQTRLVVHYLWLWVWPRQLVLDYGLPHPMSFADAAPYAIGLAFLGLITLAGLVVRSQLAFLGVWFFVTLAPASSVIPIVTEVGAERRMYLPAIALAILIALAGRQVSKRSTMAAVALFVCLASALAAATIARNTEYRSAISIWTTVVDRWPHGRAHQNLAAVLQAAGRQREMMTHLQEAVRDFPEARYDLGAQLYFTGDTEQALPQLDQFLRERPDHPKARDARNLIGKAHAKLGDAAMARKDYASAIEHYRGAVPTNQGAAGLWTSLGIALAASDRIDEAVESFRQAAAIEPLSARAHRNLANALLDARDVDGAVQHAREALRLNPQDAVTREILRDALDASAKRRR